MTKLSQPTIDWDQVYPHPVHRWNMGLRRGSLADFFAPRRTTAAACAERSRWLQEDAATYAALLDDAWPALADTVFLANHLRANIDPAAAPWEQLLTLGRFWEADFVWLHPAVDGSHKLIGGVACFPSNWALQEKLGLPITAIHAPVPGLNAQLADSIETFLTRQQPGEVWERKNMNFAADNQLNHHPAQLRKKLSDAKCAEDFWLRLEHQLLLKLPTSGSILFGIRIELFPLASVLEDAQAAARLAAIFTTMSDAAAHYKGIAPVRELLVRICEERLSK